MTVPTPAPAPAAAAPAAPGKTLGIVGLVFAFLFPLLGLILSIVAKVQSRGAGAKNTPATVGIVLSIIFMVLYILFVVVLFGSLFAGCGQLGPGVHDVNGVTLTCS
jgi:hypothetical protein